MKHILTLILVFSFFFAKAQGIEPSSVQASPYLHGILKAVTPVIDEFTGTTFYQYIHADSLNYLTTEVDGSVTNEKITALTWNNTTDSLQVVENGQIYRAKITGFLDTEVDGSTTNEKISTVTFTDGTNLLRVTENAVNYDATLKGFQDSLISGTNIKTVNSTSLLGSGNISVGTLTGSGTTNYIPKWSSSSALSNSQAFDDGTTYSIGASGAPNTLGKFEAFKGYTNTTDANIVSSGNIPMIGWNKTGSYRFAIGSGYANASTLSILGASATSTNPTTQIIDIGNTGDVRMYQNLQVDGNTRLGGSASEFSFNSLGANPTNAQVYFNMAGSQRFRIQGAAGLQYVDFFTPASGSNRNFSFATSYNAAGDFNLLRSTTAGGLPTTNVWTANSTGFGLGTGSPSQTLHVEGTARITGSEGTATGIMGRDIDGDISNVGVGSGLSVASGTLSVTNPVPSLTNGSVLFSNGTTIAQDNANLFYDDTQNVLGIGTSSPSSGAKLHISNGDLFIIGGSSRRFLLGSSVSSGFWGGMQWNTSNNLTLNHSGFTAGSNVVGLMTADGYTGLRTLGTVPLTPLDIFSSNTSDNGTYQNWAYSAAPTAYNLRLKQTVTGGNVRYNFSQVNASTAYDNVLVFDRGNIAIGATDAAQKLHVAGTARITGSDGTATGIMGRDADGDINAVGLGTGLSISAGTLTIGTLNQSTTGSAATLTTPRTIGMTGDVVYTSGSFNGSANVTGTAEIQANVVTNAELNDMATQTFKGRTTAATGDPEDLTVLQAKTMLGLTGTNSGDQTITLTGDVTGTGTGSFATTIANNAVTTAKINDGAVTTAKIAANAVTSAEINDNTIVAADLQTTGVSAGTYNSLTVNTKGQVTAASNTAAGLTADANINKYLMKGTGTTLDTVGIYQVRLNKFNIGTKTDNNQASDSSLTISNPFISTLSLATTNSSLKYVDIANDAGTLSLRRGTAAGMGSVMDIGSDGLPLIAALADFATTRLVTASSTGKLGTLPTFTTGSVIFANSTGLTQDNAGLFFSTANDRLGVGTATPQKNLHVEGNARITASDGTATTLMGRDADGDVSALALATGLSIVAGTLTPADASATNELDNVTTDLSMSGASSPYTLNSSDGTDVTFAQGTGITLSRSTNQLTISSSVAGTVTSIATNNGITGGTITSTGTIGLTGNALALHNFAANGIITQTGAATYQGRSITGSTPISVTNGSGVSGNPTIDVNTGGITSTHIANGTIAAVDIATTGVTAGTYNNVTVNAQGQVTAGTQGVAWCQGYGNTTEQTIAASTTSNYNIQNTVNNYTSNYTISTTNDDIEVLSAGDYEVTFNLNVSAPSGAYTAIEYWNGTTWLNFPNSSNGAYIMAQPTEVISSLSNTVIGTLAVNNKIRVRILNQSTTTQMKYFRGSLNIKKLK